MGQFDDALRQQGEVPYVPPLKQVPYNKDGDTFELLDSTSLRLPSVNTRETQKIGTVAGDFSPSYTGADAQTEMVRRIRAEKGFNKPVLTEKKDKYNRVVGDLVNDRGEGLSDYLAANRLADTTTFDPNASNRRDFADFDKAINRQQFKAPTKEDKYLNAMNSIFNEDTFMAKLYAPDAKSYGATLDHQGNNPYYIAPAQIKSDENYKGEARSNIATGWEQGMASMKQGAWASLDILGNSIGSDYLQTMAQRKTNAYEADLSDLPNLRNGNAFNEDGKWTLDSFSKTSDWLVGNAFASAPQMMLSIAATAAAPLTMGASLSAPAIVYAGQTWQNQESKNATFAIGSGILQAALDNFSIGHIHGSFFQKETRDKVIEELVKKGYSKPAAEEALLDSAKKSIKDITDFSKLQAFKDAEQATKQVKWTAERSLGRLPSIVVGDALAEGGTEGLQELTQYFGEQGSLSLPDNQTDMSALKNRVLNASAGGVGLGGAFGAGGHLLLRGTTSADVTPKMNDLQRQASLINTFGYVPNASEQIDRAVQGSEEANLADLAQAENLRRETSGVTSAISNWWQNKGVKSLWDKWSNMFTADGKEGNNLLALQSLLGSSRAFNGGSIEEQQRHMAQQLSNMFGSPDEIKVAFGTKSLAEISMLLSDPKITEAILKLNRVSEGLDVKGVRDAVTRYDLNADIGAHNVKYREGIIAYTEKLGALVKEYNRVTGQELSLQQALESKPVNKQAIARNTGEFKKLLMQHMKLAPHEADEVVNKILNNVDVNAITDPMEAFFGASDPLADLKNRTEQALNDPAVKTAFHKFLHHDPLANASSLAAKGAAIYTHKNLLGKNGSHLAALVKGAIDEGSISPERGSMFAKELQDWIAMRNGEYHPVNNPYVKGALDTVNFLSVVSSLPLAAISSTVEFAQVYRHLTMPQALKATKALLKGFGAEMANAIQSLGKNPEKSPLVKDYRNTLFVHGFSAEGDMGHRQDVINGIFRKWTEGFFKMTGLTSVTNITRFAKLSIGADAINNWNNTILQDLKDSPNGPPTQKAQDAREHLIRIGVDVDWMLNAEPSHPDYEQRMREQLTTGAHNFTTEAVIHPTKMNRPKFYNDPYLQLFTQFQGYTSAFTANVLPLLLKDLRKSGSADQVNAAATAAMMMALTFFALYMKDLIKYGESPPEWLKDDKKFQRFIGQAGFLGSGQRVWDAISPTVPESTKAKGFAATIASNVADQAPALAYLNKIDDALSAKPGHKTQTLVRTLPVFGTTPAFAKYLQKELGDY
jgi:hypothetical protein